MADVQPAEWPPYEESVRPEWIDYNGHVNVAFYVLAFDHATDAVLDALDLGETYRRRAGCSVFVAEMHVTYRREALAGDRLRIRSRLLGGTESRLVLLHEMTCPRLAETPLAVNEVLCVHVDLAGRRSCPWPEAVALRLADLVPPAGSASGPAASFTGRRIEIAYQPRRGPGDGPGFTSP